MLNAQFVTLYATSGGVATGSVIATYSIEPYLSDSGVFFFDGLAAGEYILSLTTDAGTLYSQPITMNDIGWLDNCDISYKNKSICQGRGCCKYDYTNGLTAPVIKSRIVRMLEVRQ